MQVCIAITDESANLTAFQRMEGGKVTSTTIAIDKAFTAAAAETATYDHRVASQSGAAAYGIASANGRRLILVSGGLPVLMNSAVVDGIGVSSGTPDPDLAVAQAGIDESISRM